MKSIRIGHGYDVHKFTTDKDHIILAGVNIPYEMGLEAHSDGDVVLHALTDALLGAIGQGDIGRHFPDNDQQYKNRDSRYFVTETLKFLAQEHYHISNVDITIAAQAPKLAPYIEQMTTSVANILSVLPSQVNIKATTTEKLGFVGRKEGIATYAVALVYQK